MTVAKLQIGLLADNRSMQKELERIAGRTDTSDPDGLHFVLTETAIQLLRRPEVWVYGHSEGKVVNGLDEGEQLFNQMSLNERGKFQVRRRIAALRTTLIRAITSQALLSWCSQVRAEAFVRSQCRLCFSHFN